MDEENDHESSVLGMDDDLVEIKVGGKIRVAMKKRLVKLSPYFESRINRFRRDKPIVLQKGTISSTAWSIINKFMMTNNLDINLDNALEVLIAANYLNIDSVQTETASFLKGHVSKQDFVQYWEIAKSMRIRELEEFISGTILKPSEAKRRRMCGEFDLFLGLGHLQLKCHKTVVFATSKRLKSLAKEDTKELLKLDVTEAGVEPTDGQKMFDLLEIMYGGTIIDDPLGVLQVVSKLGIHKTFMKKLIKQLIRKLSVDNAYKVYMIGKEMNYQDVINMALHYFMYKFCHFLDNAVILDLKITDFKKVMSHDYLNVGEEIFVLKAILQFCVMRKERLKHLEDLLTCVRWNFVTQEQVASLINQINILPSSLVQPILRQASEVKCDNVVKKRQWPQLLVLIEQPPYATNRGEMPIPSEVGVCTVQAFDKMYNKWIQLTEVPETELKWNEYERKNKITKRGRYSSQCCHSKVVLTHPKMSVSKTEDDCDMDIEQSVYDVWSGEWSSDCKTAIEKGVSAFYETDKRKKLSFLEPHSLATDNSSLFTVFRFVCETSEGVVQPKNIILSECVTFSEPNEQQTWKHHVMELDGPIHNNVPQLAVTDNNIHVLGLLHTNLKKGYVSIHSFNTKTTGWSKGTLISKARSGVVGGSYIGFRDSIYVVGGCGLDSREATGMVVKYQPVWGKPTSLQGLMKARIGPGLAVFDDMLYAAGGYAQSWEGNGATGKLIRDAETTVEYYVPAQDSWHLMNCQPKIKYGRIALGVADKPIRLIRSLSL